MAPPLLPVLLLTLLGLCPSVRAFGSGAPDSGTVCQSMVPGHSAQPQTREAPYTVQVEPNQDFLPGDSIRVIVASDGPFRGFLLTALSTYDNLPIGTMMVTDSAQSKKVCSDGATVTHTNKLDKAEVAANWTAPDDIYPGTEVIFRATVVQNYNTFWTNIDSVKITAKDPPTTEPPPTQPTPSQPPTQPTQPPTQPATPPPSGGSVILPPNPGNTVPTTTAAAKPSSGSNGSPAQFRQYLQLDPECSKTKGCLHHDCKQDGCHYVITWKNIGDDLHMTMTFRIPRSDLEYWIAIGFSADMHMGDDSVTECVMEGVQVDVKQSFNVGTFNNYLDDKHAALSNISGGVVDGILHCEFVRQKQYQYDSQVFDLNDDYFVLVAFGEALNGNKMPHSPDHSTETDHAIDLQGYENVASEEPPRSPLVYVHGILMIVGWVLLTSIGIITAKYGKPMWPKTNPFGINIWFHIHRVAMILTAVFTLVGVAVMAVDCKGYCYPMEAPGQRYLPLHPPLGIFVLILTIINPIMAFFRPAPNAANRYVFTWSHWGVGVLAWIFATLAMFIGLDLHKTQAPPEAVQVLVVWGVYHIVFVVIMETLPRHLARCFEKVMSSTVQRGKIYDLEKIRKISADHMADPPSDGNVTSIRTSDPPPADVPPEKKPVKVAAEGPTREELKVKRFLLLLHYCVVLVMTLALLLFVFLYTPTRTQHMQHGAEMESEHEEHEHHH